MQWPCEFNKRASATCHPEQKIKNLAALPKGFVVDLLPSQPALLGLRQGDANDRTNRSALSVIPSRADSEGSPAYDLFHKVA